MTETQNYVTKPNKIKATKIEGRCTRLNMLSNVYQYKGVEFVTNSMPVIGDYLIIPVSGSVEYMPAKKFNNRYELADNG